MKANRTTITEPVLQQLRNLESDAIFGFLSNYEAACKAIELLNRTIFGRVMPIHPYYEIFRKYDFAYLAAGLDEYAESWD